MLNNNMLFAAYDGDNAGRQAGRAILADDVEGLHEVSARIELGHDIVKQWVQSVGGEFLSGGGDEGIFSIPMQAIPNIEQLRSDYKFAANLTMTVGIGNTLSEAGKALMVGKFRGKNTAVQYDPSIEGEIAQARERIAQGTASAEEQKLGEAYLNPQTGGEPVKKNMEQTQQEQPAHDCPYCMEDASEPCPYCDESQGAMGHENCPYCADSDAQTSDECPFCENVAHEEGGAEEGVEPTPGPVVSEPTTTSGEDYAGKDLNTPALDKPKPDEQPRVEIASPAISYGDNQQNTPSNRALDVVEGTPVETGGIPDEAVGESPRAVIDRLDADGAEPNPEDAAAMSGTDDADLPVGDNAERHVSRPEDWGSNTPGDMGLGEDEQDPDLGLVIQEDLDVHADQAQKEKVIQMVAEALEGFKGCKPILEKAKLQAPNLYQSSLAMLRAMIEMAKMLGLSDGSESAEQVVGEQAPAEEEMFPGEAPMEEVPGQAPGGEEEVHDWNQPFKPHPSHGAAAAQGDATDPKPQSR
jgi:hypothetical protein